MIIDDDIKSYLLGKIFRSDLLNKDLIFISKGVLEAIDNNNSLALELFDTLSKQDTYDRFEEFEVIKNGEVDYISLNSLYDFYNLKFDKDSIEQRFNWSMYSFEMSKY